MKYSYILLRIVSLMISAFLSITLGYYIGLIVPVYEAIFSSPIEHSIGVTILIILNELMDITIIAVLIYAIFKIPMIVFNHTKGKDV